MDYTTLLGTWAVAISGPCVISWLAGDLAGSSRTRKLFGDDHTAFASGDGRSGKGAVGAFGVEAWSVEGSIKPLAEAPAQAAAPMAFAAQIEDLAVQAERRREERQRAVAAAPCRQASAPLSILVTSEVEAPGAPDAQAVLAGYRRSMEELQNIAHTRGAPYADGGVPVHELPSVRIAAPFMLNTNPGDLHEGRGRFSSDWETDPFIALGDR